MKGPFTNVHGWPLTANKVKETYFGLRYSEPWPKEGINPRTIEGYTVYVKALVPKAERTGLDPRWPRGVANPHRFMVICPVCDRHVSYGNLHQHIKVHRS